MTRYASYLSPEWGTWAQYDRAHAGFYRNIKKSDRRRREIAAHQAGIQQIPRSMLMHGTHYRPVKGEVRRILHEAAQ